MATTKDDEFDIKAWNNELRARVASLAEQILIEFGTANGKDRRKDVAFLLEQEGIGIREKVEKELRLERLRVAAERKKTEG